jgi:signal transduction histidine kinase
MSKDKTKNIDKLLKELEATNKEIKRTEELYRILAQNIPGFVVLIFDREYNYLLVDGTSLDTQDFPSEKIEGKNMRDVLGIEKAECIINSYDQAYVTGESVTMDFERKNKFYHSSFIPVKTDGSDDYDRGLVIVFETTEIKTIEKELEDNIKELKRTNEYLDNFVYAVAHDLKSPVSNLNSLMNLLHLEGVDKADIIEKMGKGISRLDKTLDSLVEIIDVQKNTNRTPEVVDLEEVRDLVECNIEHHIIKESPIITYDFKITKILFVEVYLISIFQNLISNSIKYSSPERICRIDVTAELIEDIVVLTFKDNGIGIDQLDYDKIFEPFNRLTTQANGRGIGLHIVKSIVENNGGTIEVDSEVGYGTEIKIYFEEL